MGPSTSSGETKAEKGEGEKGRRSEGGKIRRSEGKRALIADFGLRNAD